MMAIDVTRLNEADRIDLARCSVASDRVMDRRRIDARLLAAAALDVEGQRRWFALRVVGSSEIELRDRLTDSRVDAVVPVRTAPVKRRFGGGSRKVVHRPVLGNLVFVNIVPSDDAFAGLLRVKDVTAMVGAAGRPYPIGDREMNGFMDLAQAGAFDERATATGIKVGSEVRINVGAYADFMGILQGYGKGRTARVLTYLFGHEMIVDVKLAHLAKQE
jgi:transcriptional antiterminator NusG